MGTRKLDRVSRMSRGEQVHELGSKEHEIRRRNDEESNTTHIVRTEHRASYKGRWYKYTLRTTKGAPTEHNPYWCEIHKRGFNIVVDKATSFIWNSDCRTRASTPHKNRRHKSKSPPSQKTMNRRRRQRMTIAVGKQRNKRNPST